MSAYNNPNAIDPAYVQGLLIEARGLNANDSRAARCFDSNNPRWGEGELRDDWLKFTSHYDSCWINPNGVIFPTHLHYEFAEANGFESCGNMEQLGWVHVSGRSMYQYFQTRSSRLKMAMERLERDYGKRPSNMWSPGQLRMEAYGLDDARMIGRISPGGAFLHLCKPERIKLRPSYGTVNIEAALA